MVPLGFASTRRLPPMESFLLPIAAYLIHHAAESFGLATTFLLPRKCLDLSLKPLLFLLPSRRI